MGDYTGGPGDDTILIGSQDDITAGEVIDGGGGYDTIALHSNTVLSIDLSIATLVSIEAIVDPNDLIRDNHITVGIGQLAGVQKVSGSFVFAQGGDVSLGSVQGSGDVTFRLSAAGNRIDLSQFDTDGQFAVYGGNGNDTIIASNLTNAHIEYTFSTYYGNGGDDTIRGGALADRIDGGTGNDILEGGAGDDILTGGTGHDRMTGGAGDDTYIVDDAADKVIEAAGGGNDLIQASVSFSLAGQYVEYLRLTGLADINATGNSQVNVLEGNVGNNVLNGMGGADRMLGGAGDDTYVVDNVGDVVQELADNPGDDTVQSSISYTLGAYLEYLVLTGTAALNGTGNASDNRLTGNSGNNILTGLDGNDIIDGGAGADRMVGGNGADFYYVDNVGDQVVETATGGNDRVFSSVSYSLAGQYVELLTLTGTGNINATGNTQDNTINGNSGNNVVDGGKGADRMAGGDGNDTYYVDNTGDRVIEAATGGNDTVYSSVSFSLAGQYIETLALTGTSSASATGNGQANALIGNSNANVLDGEGGSDTLTGGVGKDVFRFDTALGATNIDTITDFSVGTDMIELDRSIFKAIAADGALASGAFYAGTAAHDADDRIVYNSATGALYYDADGTGAAKQVQFATLATGLTTLSAASFRATG